MTITAINIPKPILFNPVKHHRNYILSVLECTSPGLIISLLEPICNNYIDIYTGNLSPESIGEEVVSILKSKKVLLFDDFETWVPSNSGYRQITQEDQSKWIVRKSNETERYIHLHPARSGPFSVRFKGSTLKTVFQLKSCYPGLQSAFSLENVNLIREEVGLSPIKKLVRSKGILNCYQKFFYQD